MVAVWWFKNWADWKVEMLCIVIVLKGTDYKMSMFFIGDQNIDIQAANNQADMWAKRAPTGMRMTQVIKISNITHTCYMKFKS
jgi:2-hydroxy-3-keto-5-methylthiopentenyl-1-phosphate phosphatase